jgi:uncharacterized membrane protein YdjX (TVP38/TMEM64 family)
LGEGVEMMPFDKKTSKQLLLLIGIIIGGLPVLYVLGIFEFFMDKNRLLSIIEHDRGYAIFIFIGLQIVQVLVAILPGEVTGFVGGIVFGPFWGVVLSTVGLSLGSLIAFNLARGIGRPLVDILVSKETIRRYDYVMKRKGVFLAFLMFLIPGFPKDILCYILGLGHMRQIDFLVVSTSGRLLGTTLLTVGGSFLREGRYHALFLIVGIGIGFILIALIYREKVEYWLRKTQTGGRLRSLAERRGLKKKGAVKTGGKHPKRMPE